MDIDEYLKKKKELEHKKDVLESKNKESKKKQDHSKKEVEITRKREITHNPNRNNHSRSNNGGNDNIHWVFLGLAFFVALIILGIFFISKFMDVDNSVSEKDSDVEILQKQLEDLQKAINGTQEDIVVEVNETEEEETNETVSTIGPEFKLYLVDEHSDDISLGTFGANGKIAGNLIQIWTEDDTAIYNYRVFIENLELTEIQCKLDKKTDIDEDQDGEIDETDYHLDRYILEMNVGDEEVLNDAVNGIGKITVEYEARCYFCEYADCENVFLEGETVETAKLKVNIETTEVNETA